MSTRRGDAVATPGQEIGVCSDIRPLLVGTDIGHRLIGIGRSEFAEMLARGEIRSIKQGRRRLVPLTAIEEWIDRKLAESAA